MHENTLGVESQRASKPTAEPLIPSSPTILVFSPIPVLYNSSTLAKSKRKKKAAIENNLTENKLSLLIWPSGFQFCNYTKSFPSFLKMLIKGKEVSS